LINPVACPAGKSPSFRASTVLVFIKIQTGCLIRSEIRQSDLGCPLGLRSKQKEKYAEKIHPKIKRSEK
jgi:hypothetical protein